ncbi:MAG: class II glutamine amidotransferase [archaeon]
MCSIFGTDILNEDLLIPELATQGEERGTDATGVCTLMKNKTFSINKKPIKASLFPWGEVPNQNVEFYLGHTRKTTKGKASFNENNHPFKSENNDFVLAHNGTIYNTKELIRKNDLTENEIETDSYVILQLLETIKYMYQEDTINIDIIAEVCEVLKGTFALSILTQNKLFLLRHKRPLSVAYNGENIIYASTEKMINNTLVFLGKKDITKFMGSVVGSISEDVIYEYDINEHKFTNKEEFTTPVYNTYKNVSGNYSNSSYGNNYYNDTNNNKSKNNNKSNKNSYGAGYIRKGNIYKYYGEIIEAKTYKNLTNEEKKYYRRCEECERYYYVDLDNGSKYDSGGFDSKSYMFLCFECQYYLYESKKIIDSATEEINEKEKKDNVVYLPGVKENQGG